MRLSYKEWFVFCWSLSLWIRSRGDGNCSRRATLRLGIDTLIANILVSNYLDHLLFARQLTSRRTTSIVATQVLCCYCRNWNIILANHFGVLRGVHDIKINIERFDTALNNIRFFIELSPKLDARSSSCGLVRLGSALA